jgi:hypothetical protein
LWRRRSSTPEETSTPKGFSAATAVPTFTGVRPPATMTGAQAGSARKASHAKAAPVPPAMPRTNVSSRNAIATPRYGANAAVGSNPSVTRMALMTGAGAASQACGDSSPWNCTAERRSSAVAALTKSGSASTNTPTRATNGGTSRSASAASSSETCRGPSVSTTPSASAPALTAAAASSALVIPHILMRVLCALTFVLPCSRGAVSPRRPVVYAVYSASHNVVPAAKS